MKKNTTTAPKLSSADLANLVGEDDALFMNLLSTRLISLIATGQVDAQHLAQEAMAARGLDDTGKWIGFAAAAKFWQSK